MTNGSIAPAREALRSADRSAGHADIPLRSTQRSAEVGSHGASPRSLRSRTSLQARPSRIRGGRSRTGPATSSAGQPGWADIPDRSALREQQRNDGDPRARDDLADVLVDDDQAVSRRQRRDQVRARTPDEGDAVGAVRLAMQHAATILPHADRALDPLDRHRLDGRALQLPLAEQLADRRSREDLERHERADRGARQAEDRDVVAEKPEALGPARLHGDPDEVDRPQFGERLLHDIEGAHADATRR